MGIIEGIKNSVGKKGIDCMDQNSCKMIVEYGKKLLKEEIDLTSSGTNDDDDVPNSDYNKDYVDLDTVGAGVSVWWWTTKHAATTKETMIHEMKTNQNGKNKSKQRKMMIWLIYAMKMQQKWCFDNTCNKNDTYKNE